MLPLSELGRHVRRQRLLLELTQTELARDAGTSQSLVAKLEQGRLNPSYETVRLVLGALEQRSRRQEPVARELMQRQPFWVSPDDTLGEALAQMKRQGFSQAPVVENGRPVGSVSERAVLERLERGEDLESVKGLRASQAMGPGFPTVEPEASRRLLVEMLRENDAVLVLEGGRMQGVVTKSDLW